MSRSSKTAGTDLSSRAQNTLDYILADEETKEIAEEEAQMPVSQALQAEHVVHFSSGRTRTRVLFVSSDPAGLKEESALRKHITEVAGVFEEVHLLVLLNGKKQDRPAVRVSDNIWIYGLSYRSSWFLDQAVGRFAESQLQFGDGFRPDVIVSLDPYSGGKAATYLAKRYERPVQIHISEDFMSESFRTASKENKQKAQLAEQLLKKAQSVRTDSTLIRSKLEKQFPKIEDLGMLPRHFDTNELVKAKRGNVLKEKYPQYVFIILAAGLLDQDSTMYKVMDAARSLLFSPKIGMVVVGEGPVQKELMNRANILGINEQIVFEPKQSVLTEYMLSADMFISADTSAIGDEYIIQAAAAGLPIVMAKTPLREDLFVDGESAFLCDPENISEYTQKMNSILNTNAFRLQFGTNARQMVRDRLHTDPNQYLHAYRDTIEVVFAKAGDSKNEDEGWDTAFPEVPEQTTVTENST